MMGIVTNIVIVQENEPGRFLLSKSEKRVK